MLGPSELEGEGQGDCETVPDLMAADEQDLRTLAAKKGTMAYPSWG